MIKRSAIEIMAPAGSYESLLAAIEAGADSVYFGVGALNMRAASAANFTLDDLDEIVKIAHKAGVKAYLTVNTIIYDNEIEQMHAVVDRAAAAKVDAIIAADQSVISTLVRAGWRSTSRLSSTSRIARRWSSMLSGPT